MTSGRPRPRSPATSDISITALRPARDEVPRYTPPVALPAPSVNHCQGSIQDEPKRRKLDRACEAQHLKPSGSFTSALGPGATDRSKLVANHATPVRPISVNTHRYARPGAQWSPGHSRDIRATGGASCALAAIHASRKPGSLMEVGHRVGGSYPPPIRRGPSLHLRSPSVSLHQPIPPRLPVQVAFWVSTAVLLGAFIGGYWSRVPVILSLLLMGAVVLAVGYLLDPWLFVIPLAVAWEAIDPAKAAALAPPRTHCTDHCCRTGQVHRLHRCLVSVFSCRMPLDWRRAAGFPYLTVSLIAGSWLLFGAVSGHWDWPADNRGSLEGAGGYSSAMQLRGPTAEIVRGIVIATIIVAIALLTPSRGEGARRGVTRIGVAVVSALIAFLLLKAGVVRHDAHITVTAGGLLLLVALVTWRVVGRGAGQAARLLALVVVPLAAYNLLAAPDLHWSGPPPLETVKALAWDRPKTAFNSAAALVLGDVAGQFPQTASKHWRLSAPGIPFRPLTAPSTSTIGTRPTCSRMASDYSPRPIFQSYSAYTPGLIERNAESIAGPTARTSCSLRCRPSITGCRRWRTASPGRSYGAATTPSRSSRHTPCCRDACGPTDRSSGGKRASTIGWEEPLALSTSGRKAASGPRWRSRPTWPDACCQRPSRPRVSRST